jgi:DeoR/GlpR family transcriptional regulator of sugar metabolism
VRRERIAKLIRHRQTVSVSELSQMFAASKAIIRRDLTKLEEEGLLKRTYGGAVSLHRPADDLLFTARAQKRVAEKQAIALAAAELVSEGETIVLDTGTTTAMLARALRSRRNLTVITNSERIMHELFDCENVTVIVTGGTPNPHGAPPEQADLILAGPVAEATLRRFRPAKAFMGTAGITIAEGMSNFSLLQSQIKQLMIEIAEEVILLSDHTKFGRVSYFLVAPVNVLDKVVTDSGIRPEDRIALEERGIEVVVAEPVPEVMPS